MAKTFPFPEASLYGIIKKASYSLQPTERAPLLKALESKTKPNPLIQKAKTLVICVMSAKESDDETFEQDLSQGIDGMKPSTAEHLLFDGLLGAKLSMALDVAKKGVPQERLSAIRSRLHDAYARADEERKAARLQKAQAMADSAR